MMHDAQCPIRVVVQSLRSWLSAVNQRQASLAQDELHRIRELTQGLLGDHQYLRALKSTNHGDFSSHSASVSAGIDFIAAATEAMRPGRYRADIASQFHQPRTNG